MKMVLEKEEVKQALGLYIKQTYPEFCRGKDQLRIDVIIINNDIKAEIKAE